MLPLDRMCAGYLCCPFVCHLLKSLSPRKDYPVGRFGPFQVPYQEPNLRISIPRQPQKETGMLWKGRMASCQPKTLKWWLQNDLLNWWFWSCFDPNPQQKIQFTSWARVCRCTCMCVFKHNQDKSFSEPNLFLAYTLHSVLFYSVILFKSLVMAHQVDFMTRMGAMHRLKRFHYCVYYINQS